MATPKWAVGMRVLAPGIYLDAQNGMHVDEPGICAHLGLPYTAHNSAVIESALRDALADLRIPAVIKRDDEEDQDAHT